MILDENLFESIRTRKGVDRLRRFRRDMTESEEGDKIAQSNIDSKNINFEKDKETTRQTRMELAKQGVATKETGEPFEESIKGNTRVKSFTSMLKDLGIDNMDKLDDLFSQLRVDPDYEDMFKGRVNEYEIVKKYYDEANPEGRNIANEDLQARNIVGEDLTFKFENGKCITTINGEDKVVDLEPGQEQEDLKKNLIKMGFKEIKSKGIKESYYPEIVLNRHDALDIFEDIEEDIYWYNGRYDANFKLNDYELVISGPADALNQIIDDYHLEDYGINKFLITYENLEEDLSIEEQQNIGLVTLVNNLVTSENDAINDYESAIATFAAEGRDEFMDVFKDIIREEQTHIGQLQSILEQLKPGTITDLEKGQAEADGQIAEIEGDDMEAIMDIEDANIDITGDALAELENERKAAMGAYIGENVNTKSNVAINENIEDNIPVNTNDILTDLENERALAMKEALGE